MTLGRKNFLVSFLCFGFSHFLIGFFLVLDVMFFWFSMVLFMFVCWCFFGFPWRFIHFSLIWLLLLLLNIVFACILVSSARFVTILIFECFLLMFISMEWCTILLGSSRKHVSFRRVIYHLVMFVDSQSSFFAWVGSMSLVVVL